MSGRGGGRRGRRKSRSGCCYPGCLCGRRGLTFAGTSGQGPECLLECSIHRMRGWRLCTGSHAPLVGGGSRGYLPTLPGRSSVRCEGLPASEPGPRQKTLSREPTLNSALELQPKYGRAEGTCHRVPKALAPTTLSLLQLLVPTVPGGAPQRWVTQKEIHECSLVRRTPA